MADENGLREAVDRLSSTITELKVNVGVLGVGVINLADRAREDREAAAKVRERINRIEEWKNRVIGGLVLVSVAVVAIGGTVAAYIIK